MGFYAFVKALRHLDIVVPNSNIEFKRASHTAIVMTQDTSNVSVLHMRHIRDTLLISNVFKEMFGENAYVKMI